MLNCVEEKILIDTYPEAAREELPMFAENRVHQRTSGNPYPNKVVLEAQRSVREKQEYTLLRLENDYLEIGILPALGGKIWYAVDRKNGYPIFYKNNVVKPALIGALGSWTSGGLEFNWPFHHRASTFMPVDYFIERKEGEVTVWLSEHDPIDRMKGMVGVSLKEGECVFTTKTKLDNTTSLRRSFLWWENAAVPVGKSYRIFFPEDVNYVRFHYKRSVTTYPVANNDRFGAYNGILFGGDLNISEHRNTVPATSYFSAESRFDFFGGYDEEKRAGVVHVADHHISPGKKLFTWGYGQLSKTWERALTDTDGQYAELMAGCWSDNQPDFSWLEPYESRSFAQHWFPIHGHGVPVFANACGALLRDDGELFVQSVRAERGVNVRLEKDGKLLSERTLDLPAYETVSLFKEIPKGASVTLKVGVRTLMSYQFDCTYEREIPSPREELPVYTQVESAEELYLEGLHMEQYRSPEYAGKTCFLEALKRDPEHAPSLLALAELALKEYRFEEALSYTRRALARLTRFNARTESGRAYYLEGLALLGSKRFEEGYDSFARAAWSADAKAAANFHLGLLSMRNKDYGTALEKLSGATGVVAEAFLGYCQFLAGEAWERTLNGAIASDPLNLYAHALMGAAKGDYAPFCALVETDLNEVALDIAEYMLEAGLVSETSALLRTVLQTGRAGASVAYLLRALTGEKVEIPAEGIAFPSRAIEEAALRAALKDGKDGYAAYLLGCLLYGKKHYEEAAEKFLLATRLSDDYRAWRCLSVYAYSRLHDGELAKEYLARAERSGHGEKQIIFERAYLLFHTGETPENIARYLERVGYDRDDLTVELARAYNLSGQPARALDVLLARSFVACEGGEHYIADEYTFAHYLQGRAFYLAGDYVSALKEFRLAQELPASLGAGFWNECKKVPFQYFEARCLQKLNREEEARAILSEFFKYRFDYFSNMYLPTLPYYVGKAYELMGQGEKGRSLVAEHRRRTENAMREPDTGYFGTTPFFISYLEEPRLARERTLAYPLTLYCTFLGDKAAAEKYATIAAADGYNLRIEDFT